MRREKITHAIYWQVIQRGAGRLDIFRDDEDRSRFLTLLRKKSAEHGVPMLSYILMDNHFHLEPESDGDRLGRLMHDVTREHSEMFNKKYGRSGALYQGRYSRYAIASPMMVPLTAMYIMNNPVAAGIVKDASQYPWSSIAAYEGRGTLHVPVKVEPVLRILGEDLGRARSEFLARMKAMPPESHSAEEPAYVIQGLYCRWIMEKANSVIPQKDAQRVGITWAHHFGVPPRVISRQLGIPTETVKNILRDREAWLRLYPPP